jgi:undecaprenyl phosphate N,N'-diacetylbacillosamine 1-phosphate transferase
MRTFYNSYIKRICDFLLALIVILCFCWLWLVLWLLVRAKLGGPALFRQERPGRYGRIFTLYKFRTMTDAVDEDGQLLPDEDRLTPFGRRLRSTSLDEVPEIFNILKGDMSLIGPRPLLVRYLPRYSPEQARRHDVRPGLTGWAQVNGRNAISWEQKFEYDVWYVDHVSAWLDLKIIAKTALSVIRREGISAEGEATVGEFFGNGGL